MTYNLPTSLSGAGRLSVGFNDAHARIKITACSNSHYVGKRGVYTGSVVSNEYYVVNENGIHNFSDSLPIPALTTVESRYSFAGCFQTWAGGDNPVSTKMFEYKGDLYLVFTMCINNFEGPVSSSWPQGETGPTDLSTHPLPPSMIVRMHWDGEELVVVDKANLSINASTAVFIVDEYAGELIVTYSEAAYPVQQVKTFSINLVSLTKTTPTTLFSVDKTLCPTDDFDARNVIYTSGVLSYDENEPIVRITNSEIIDGVVSLTFTVSTPNSREVAIVPYVAKREVLGETTPFSTLPAIPNVQTSVTGLEYTYSYPFSNPKECYLQHKVVAVDKLGPHGIIDVEVVGTTATFSAARSWCLDSEIVEYKWNVGVFSGSGISASYTFPNPSQYLIYLTLRDANGVESTTTSQLTIGTPVASFTTSISGLRVTLTPSGGTKYTWEIKGTGTWESPTVFHFAQPQTAEIILTVDDTYTTSQTLTVNYVLPTAAFTTSTTFMDIALNGSGGVGYAWSFSGDIVGSFVVGSATSQNAVFRCTEEYSGTATLTVTDEYGIKDSVSHPVATAVTAPTAAFVSTISGGKVTLDALTSTSPNGDVVGYSWSFSPSLPATYLFGDSEKPVITLLFSSNYTGTATLRITDDKGKEDDVSSALNVTVVTPVPVISATQYNDTLVLDASGSTGATNYLWALSGSPVGYWVVGDANTEIAHFRFTEVYSGTLSLTVNGVTTSTPITVNYGVSTGFAARTATAYRAYMPQILFADFADNPSFAYDVDVMNLAYASAATRTSEAYATTILTKVVPSRATSSPLAYTPLLAQIVKPSMAVRTPIAIATSLSFRTYPDAATRTPTAYGVTFA